MGKPIHLFWSPLSHRVYATRAWKEVKRANRGIYVECTGEKFDVTDQIKDLIAAYGPDFAGGSFKGGNECSATPQGSEAEAAGENDH